MRLYRVKSPMISFLLFMTPASSASDLEIELGKLENPKFKYIRYTELSGFPTSVLVARRIGLASRPQEIVEIKEKIVYALLNESDNPIAAIVIGFFSKGGKDIGVQLYWSNRNV